MRRILTAAVLAAAATDAGEVRAELRDLGGGVFVDRVPGGPRLLLLPQRSVPMFSCTVLVPAGSALETPATNGAAHYLEHLLFNGTTARTREEIYALGDRLGAYNNASTQRERTVFQLLLPSEHWRDGLELQADMLLHSTLPPDKFDKEKGIILEELAKDRTDPSYEESLFQMRAVYGDAAHALPVLGSETSISNMDPAALRAFYRERYQPSGLTMIVMGDFDPAAARKEVGRLYGEESAADDDPPPLPPRPPFPTDTVIRYAEIPELGKIHVRVMFPLPAISSPDLGAMILLADVLDAGEYSAVSRVVEALNGTVLGSSVSLDLGEPWSLLTIALDLPEGAAGAPAIGAILEHLRDVAGGEHVRADLETARFSRVVEEISLREKMHYYGLMRADLLGGGDPAVADRVLKQLGDVPVARLWDILSDAVHGDRMVATVVGPGVGDGVEQLTPVAAGPPKENDTLVGVEAIHLPTVSSTTRPETRRTVLDNGVTLINEANPGARTFAINVLFRDRSLREKESGVPRGTADVVHRMMERGTSSMTEDALRGRITRLGAKLKVTDSDWIPYDDYYYTPEFSYVRLETIDSFGIAAIELLGEVVKRPRFEASTLEAAVAAAAARAEEDEGQPRTRANRAFYSALGEGHPLAGGVHGPADELRELSLEDVRRHHAVMVAPPNLIIAVSGSLPPDEVEAAVRRTFGGEGTAVAPLDAEGPAFRPRTVTGTARVEVEAGAEQSYIMIGTPLDLPADDEAALRVAVAILSERLAERLREREGLAYSIGATVRLTAPGPNVRLIAGTRPENLERMETGMLEVARSLVDDPPSADEVEGARNRGEGRRRMRRLSRIGQAYALAMAELHGEDPRDLDADRPSLAAVEPDDVARVADHYLRFESSICAIAR